MSLYPADPSISPLDSIAAVFEATLWWTTPILADFINSFFYVVVSDSELITLKNFPPFGLWYIIWDCKGTFFNFSMSISRCFRSFSPLTSYSNEIFVFVVALAKFFTSIVLLSFRRFWSSFLNSNALWSIILASTLRPTTSSLRMLAKSSDNFSGLTTFTFPLVASTTRLRTYSFELSPLMVTMLTDTFFSLALMATSS